MATTASLLELGDLGVDAAALEVICRRYQVQKMSVFGSAARGEMRSDSDVDLLIEFEPEAVIGLFAFETLADELTELFGRRADIGTRLKPHVHARVEKDLRVIYSR